MKIYANCDICKKSVDEWTLSSFVINDELVNYCEKCVKNA